LKTHTHARTHTHTHARSVLTTKTERVLEKQALLRSILSASANATWRAWGAPPVTEANVLRNMVTHSEAVIARLRYMVETGRDKVSASSPGTLMKLTGREWEKAQGAAFAAWSAKQGR